MNNMSEKRHYKDDNNNPNKRIALNQGNVNLLPPKIQHTSKYTATSRDENVSNYFNVPKRQVEAQSSTHTSDQNQQQYKFKMETSFDVRSVEAMNTSKNTTSVLMETAKEEQKIDNMAGNKRIRFLSGNPGRVIKWHRILRDIPVHYEVIGPIISLQEGNIRMQKIYLMRDVSGPVLKIVHYSTDRIHLPNFFLGQVVRCVGRMIGSTSFQAIYIREAKPSEIEKLARLYYICEQEIVKFGK